MPSTNNAPAAAHCPHAAQDFSSRDFRDALGRFPTGVTVVTAWDAASARPLGMTVSSFNSVSLAPPLVLWSLGREGSMAGVIERCEHWAVHVLAASQRELAWRFASHVNDRFAGIAWRPNAQGVPLLDGACATFECASFARHAAGDHTIMVGHVLRCTHEGSAAPLLYHGGALIEDWVAQPKPHA